ncbi:EpsG-like putative glucosyltransferase [Chryseobacterium geocarposphaerae]|uniref:EpsG-like putative glucosyltransferase n=2 Tax=Chryseobacterium geocarposphaerae TaxID=1416776 RepID=A0A2M9CAC4_9FLAO|nr:EpsG-like putative glucosyltransferase [Chryseobacterium geocarposphaerae]
MEPTFSFTYSIPYIILFLIYFVLFLWENKLRNSDRDIKIIRYLGMFIFFIFFGFRGYIDTDFAVYYPLYETAPTLSDFRGISDFFSGGEDFLLKVEPGFKVILVLLKSINKSYFLLQIVSSFIDVLFLNYFFKKYSPQYILGFIMFLIFSGLVIEINLIRNSKAIFLFIYSLQFIKERNALKYFICNGIGLLFHSSSIFYFPLYFFLHKKLPPQVVWGTFILGNVLYLGQIKFITPIVIGVGNFFGGFYAIMAEAYSKSSMYSDGYGITIGYLEKFLTFIIFYKSYDKIGEYIKDEKLLNIFFNLFFIFTTTYLFLSEYSVLIDRMTTLFVVSYWILYPYLYVVLNRVVKIIFTFVLLLFGILKMYKANNFIIRKYENILWNKPTISRAYFIFNKHIDKILTPKK